MASRAELEGRHDQALLYYRRAADMGHPVGLNSVGRFLEFGLAVKKDMEAAYERCVRWPMPRCTRGCLCTVYRLRLEVGLHGNGVRVCRNRGCALSCP